VLLPQLNQLHLLFIERSLEANDLCTECGHDTTVTARNESTTCSRQVLELGVDVLLLVLVLLLWGANQAVWAARARTSSCLPAVSSALAGML
jgi:hypothetical protein